MKLVKSEQISRIDTYAREVLGIPTAVLMGRAGEGVADVVRSCVAPGGTVVILAGRGNNGGDGYALAGVLAASYAVTVYDVLGPAPRTDEARQYRERCLVRGVCVLPFSLDERVHEHILSADCLVDAVFGTGRRGDVPPIVETLASWIRESRAYKIAVDIPLGVDADDGTVSSYVYRADVTVVLSYYKVGMLSYPAREYLGRTVLSTLGLPRIPEADASPYECVDDDLAASILPTRGLNTHKGSFGKLLTLVGSMRYRGAAHLALGAALRSGVGLVTFLGQERLVDSLLPTYPEALYRTDICQETEDMLDRTHGATLIGCGCGTDEGLCERVLRLLRMGTTPLVLDADAINALARRPKEGREALRASSRPVVLTPHPLELARLIEMGVDAIQDDRLSVAIRTARELGVVLVLKGAGTIITDGERVFINTTGSSALAKGGSGDVLAGLVGGLCASGVPALLAAALAAFVHGAAADRLSACYCELGVIPSDLPLEMARVLGDLAKKKSRPWGSLAYQDRTTPDNGNAESTERSF